MRKFRHYTLLLLAAIAMFGCGSEYDDSALKGDIADLKGRVEKLEEWSKTANSQISALQGLVTALDARDYITGVSPILEGSKEVGHTITFAKSGAITIRDGKEGANGITPVVGVKKDTDDVYYWTVQYGATETTWMLDADGKKIQATGGATQSPQLSVATDTDGKVYWKVNGEWMLNAAGKKVQATGDKGEQGDTGASGSDGGTGPQGPQGDAVFEKNGVDVSDPTKVTFKLAAGGSFTLPRTSDMKIFDSFADFKVDATTLDLPLFLNVKEDNFAALKAEITTSQGMSFDMVKATTRAATTPWGIALTAPTFKADKTIDTNASVTFTLPADVAEGEVALLKVTLIDKAGQEHAATRIILYGTATTPPAPSEGLQVGDFYPDATNPVGIVFQVDPDDATKGLILSLDEAADQQWSTENVATDAISDSDGVANTNTIKAISGYETKYPAAAWCVAKGDGWYLPCLDDALSVYHNMSAINTKLTAVGKLTISGAYWTSTEKNENSALSMHFTNANIPVISKVDKRKVRAIAAITSSGITPLPTPPAADFFTVNGIKVAKGNLVANGENGAKIGEPTDGDLFFQFGSLIGWSETGAPTIAVRPVGYTGSTSWNKNWAGDPTTDDVATGKGDPCRYYLKGAWRLPTKGELVTLFSDKNGYPSTGPWTREGTFTEGSSSYVIHTSGLKFRASGYRNLSNGDGGILTNVGSEGYYWSVTPYIQGRSYNLYFKSSAVKPDDFSMGANGCPVRCVRD